MPAQSEPPTRRTRSFHLTVGLAVAFAQVAGCSSPSSTGSESDDGGTTHAGGGGHGGSSSMGRAGGTTTSAGGTTTSAGGTTTSAGGTTTSAGGTTTSAGGTTTSAGGTTTSAGGTTTSAGGTTTSAGGTTTSAGGTTTSAGGTQNSVTTIAACSPTLSSFQFANGWNLANSQTYAVGTGAELPSTRRDTNATLPGWQGLLVVCADSSKMGGCGTLSAQLSDQRAFLSSSTPMDYTPNGTSLLCAQIAVDLPDGGGGSNHHQVTLTTTVTNASTSVGTLSSTVVVNSAKLAELAISGPGANLADRRAGNLEATWTSPGSDAASSYEVVFSTTAIDPSTFGQGANASTASPPASVGSTGTKETAKLSGGNIETAYYVGVKVTDAGGAVNYNYTTTAATTAHFRVAYLPALESTVNYGSAIDGSASLTKLDSNASAPADLVIGGSYGITSSSFASKVGIYQGPNSFDTTNPYANTPTIILTNPGTSTAAFGTSIANIHDLDGDGYRELAIGAPFDDKVYIYRGGSNLSTGAPPTWTIGGAGVFAGASFGSAVADAYDVLGASGVVIAAPWGTNSSVAVIPKSALCTPVGSPATCTMNMSETLSGAYYLQTSTPASSVRSFNFGNGSTGLIVGESTATSNHGRLSYYPSSSFVGAGFGGAQLVGAPSQTLGPLTTSTNEQWGAYLPALMLTSSGTGWMLPSNGPNGQLNVTSFASVSGAWSARGTYQADLSSTTHPFGSFIQGGLLSSVAVGGSIRTFNYVDRGKQRVVFGVTDASSVPHLGFLSEDQTFAVGTTSLLSAVTSTWFSFSPPPSLPTWKDFAANPIPAADLDGDGYADVTVPAIDPALNDYNGYVAVVF